MGNYKDDFNQYMKEIDDGKNYKKINFSFGKKKDAGIQLSSGGMSLLTSMLEKVSNEVKYINKADPI